MQELKHPIVSVCIANYNGIGVIEACIASVKAQIGDLPVEIIVHDDASSDESVDYFRTQHPDVTLIQSSENVGFCISNNRLASQAQGQYLLLLNNDAELLTDALTSLYQATQDLGVPAILGLPQYDATSGALLDAGSLLDPFLNPIPNLDLNRRQVGMVMGACLWIPKTLWHELDGFPTWFGSIGEDLYLCCRARLAGYPVIALNASGFRHRVGHSFGGGKVLQNRLITSRKRRALSERNKSYVLVLSYPTPYLEFFFALHIVALVLEGVIITITKLEIQIWNRIYLECLKALWKQRGLLRDLRRTIQKNKRVSTREFFAVFKWYPYKIRMLWKHGIPTIQ